MKKLLTILILLAAFGCQKENVDADCVEKISTDYACYEIYAPVCGCNGKTYANDCFAEAHGITSYTPGECKSDK